MLPDIVFSGCDVTLALTIVGVRGGLMGAGLKEREREGMGSDIPT
jgi:hypothetical protein